MGKFTRVVDLDMYERALKLCRGEYQRNIIRGNEAVSGSTLKGAAKKYWGSYRESVESLLKRCEKAGIVFTFETAAHGRKVLVIGGTPSVREPVSMPEPSSGFAFTEYLKGLVEEAR